MHREADSNLASRSVRDKESFEDERVKHVSRCPFREAGETACLHALKLSSTEGMDEEVCRLRLEVKPHFLEKMFGSESKVVERKHPCHEFGLIDSSLHGVLAKLCQ